VGAARGRGHRGGEGGCQWAPLILVVAEVGKEGVGGRRSSSWSPRWGRRASVGAVRPHGRRGGEEGVGGSRSSSWSPRWGRRVSVGAAHPRGRRGGEGGRRWAPLVVVVTEVGKEGVGGRPSWSWLPRWGRRASVGAARGRPRLRQGRSCAPPTASASPCHRRPPPPRHAAAYHLCLAKPSDRHAAAYRADCRLAKTREKREERGPNERREKREDPTRG
jgi:hypothetical protein